MKNEIDVRISVAIYARYSTDNQDEQTIEAQIATCKQYADLNGFVVADRHIFSDEAESGQNRNRSGLAELMKLAEIGAIKAVLAFNTARMARDQGKMGDIRKTLDFYDVELILVGDGLRTSSPSAGLSISVKSMFDEYFVDHIRQSTLNTLRNKVERNYVAGNLPYGYRVVPTGEVYYDSRGRKRSEGSKGEIVEAQATVIRRVFKDFADGIPLSAIVKQLNVEKVPTLKSKGWNTSTLSKMLKNEVYIGKYSWGKATYKWNPKTGYKEKRPGKAGSLRQSEMPHLRIIEQEVWNKVQQRFALAPRAGVKGFKNSVSRNLDHPKHLLCGLMKCGVCGGAINITGTGKSGVGFYGCQMYQRRRCSNKRMVNREKLEAAVIDGLKRHVLNPEALKRVLEGVREELTEQTKHVPEELASKNRELEQVQGKERNLINVLAEGNFSDA